MKIAIIGYGHVGKIMHKLFKDAYIYDKMLNIGKIEHINEYDVAFICVPTPATNEGKCDTSIVEEIIKKVNVKLFIIRSTVWIGFTNYAVKKYKKNIVFQPEYCGETPNHPLLNLSKRSWMSFGGVQSSIDKAIECYKTVLNSDIKLYQANANEVELAKYMENAFLATKIIFVNEMYDIAKAFDINYNIAREIWLADPRINASHTFVYENKRGYEGKCLPKDVANLKSQSHTNNVITEQLSGTIKQNKIYNNNKIK